MSNTTQCHACGADMVRDVRPDTVLYKGHSVPIRQPGWYCNECDEVVLDGPDAAVSDRAFIRLKARIDRLLTPQEVTRIRKRLGLSQRRASALLGGGPRSFQKYESGSAWVSRSMANLLRLLDRDPKGLDVLADQDAQGQGKPAASDQASAAPSPTA